MAKTSNTAKDLSVKAKSLLETVTLGAVDIVASVMYWTDPSFVTFPTIYSSLLPNLAFLGGGRASNKDAAIAQVVDRIIAPPKRMDCVFDADGEKVFNHLLGKTPRCAVLAGIKDTTDCEVIGWDGTGVTVRSKAGSTVTVHIYV